MTSLTFAVSTPVRFERRISSFLPARLCRAPDTIQHAFPPHPTVVCAGASKARPHSSPKRLRGGSHSSRTRNGVTAPPHPANTKLGEQERLQKVMSRLGVASRRQSEAMITEGRVRVNGHKVREQGRLVNPRSDRIVVDGTELVTRQRAVWVAVHKPRGYLSVPKQGYKRTVEHLVPKARELNLATVANLDASFSGLVIMTNERGCIPELASPHNRHVKHWTVDCDGMVSNGDIEPLRSGIRLDGDPNASLPADVRIVGSEKVELSRGNFTTLTRIDIRVRESRYRLIKRMFEAIDVTVVRASRRGIGPILLGSLKRGDFRYLTPNEIKALKRGVNHEQEAHSGSRY